MEEFSIITKSDMSNEISIELIHESVMDLYWIHINNTQYTYRTLVGGDLDTSLAKFGFIVPFVGIALSITEIHNIIGILNKLLKMRRVAKIDIEYLGIDDDIDELDDFEFDDYNSKIKYTC